MNATVDIYKKKNPAAYFIDRHIEENRGDRIAIEYGERRLTYRELFENVNRVGNALGRLGLIQGERILIILPDMPEFAAIFFGAIKIGIIPIPTSTLLESDDYEYIINDSGAKTAIIHETVLSKIESIPREHRGDLKNIMVLGEAFHGFKSFKELMNTSSEILEPTLFKDADSNFWLYTSGSTGRPKACVHRGQSMIVCAEHYAKNILKMTQDDKCFSVGKLFFAYGLGNALYYPLSVGATAVLVSERLKAAGIFALIERHRPTLFFSVPTNYVALLAEEPAPGRGDFDLSSVRLCISAAEPLPATIFENFKKRFKKEIWDGIGATEGLQCFITNRSDALRPGSCGKVVPGYEAKLVDEHGEEVQDGAPGNLMVKTNALFVEYWHQPEKTKSALRDGWLWTNDVFQKDSDGYYWCIGRSDDMIKSNGAWVSPTTVEHVLMEHPAVAEVAVVGKKDSDGLMKPAAHVVLIDNKWDKDAAARELDAYTRERLRAYQRPAWFFFKEELPKTGTGKIQRYKLRES